MHNRLIVRITAGSACDMFGPRWTFAVLLLLGALPTGLAGAVHDAAGLTILRSFIGILGGTFIPCQVWTTGFFDKNVVGTANALTAGLGNAGSGITYFAMPAIYDSLKYDRGLESRVAWRVAFVVPFVLIVAAALVMIFACPDSPTGKWSARRRMLDQQFAKRDAFITTVKQPKVEASEMATYATSEDKTGRVLRRTPGRRQDDHQTNDQDLLEAASWELVEKPTVEGSSSAVFSLPTLTLIVVYFSSFGAELAVNSFLGAYYLKNFPQLGQTGAGNWASMFGLFNAVLRPIGGMISDALYRSTGSLWGKKMLIHGLNFGMAAFLLVIGLLDPQSKALMFGLVFGLSFFLEASNGACFSLVPHVSPSSNGEPILDSPGDLIKQSAHTSTVSPGIITGVTGASGTLGGILFLLVVRYNLDDYAKSIWIIGVICIALNLAVIWIRPIPKGQLGGR